MTVVPQHRHPYLRNHVDYTDAFLMAKFPGEYVPPGEEEPPPPPRTTYGAAVWNHYLDWQPMLDALGLPDLACRRTYYTPERGVPSHYADGAGGLSVDVAAGRGSQVSFKPNPGTVADGTHDAALVSLLASKPAGLHWRVAIGNEDEAPDKGIDPAARVADSMALLDIRDDAPNASEIKITQTHMGYSFDVGRPVELWLPPALRTRLDSISINHYQVLGSPWKTWRAIMTTTVGKVIDEWGLPIVMWEWGYPEDDANPSRKPDVIAEHAAWCEEYGVEVSCHYNTDQGQVSRDPRYLQTSSPATTAAFRGLFATT